MVVSAMSGETNRLLKLAKQITDSPTSASWTSIAATGEQVTRRARRPGHPGARAARRARSSGTRSRIVTDSAFTKARIKGIDGRAIDAALEDGQDRGGRRLPGRRRGRATSPRSAAAAPTPRRWRWRRRSRPTPARSTPTWTASTPPIPNICPTARKIDRISYEEMLELASLGAKVLQIRSVEFAMKYRVPLHVRSCFTDDAGTWVCGEEKAMEDVVVSGVAYDKDEAKIAMRRRARRARRRGEDLRRARRGGHRRRHDHPERRRATGRTDLTFTCRKADLTKRARLLVKNCGDLCTRRADRRPTTRSPRCPSSASACAPTPAWRRRCSRSWRERASTSRSSPPRRSRSRCVIDAKYTELAVRALHDGFGLGNGKS